MTPVTDPRVPTGYDWILLDAAPLPTASAMAWAAVPGAGAVVTFSGIVRDHAEGRTDVTALTYEAYESEATRVMGEIAASARRQWPDAERIAILHRVGRLGLGEASVVVVVSSPHRAVAFDAARYCIDTLKESVPIWKQEHHSAGDDWGLGAHAVRPVGLAERS
jgi:molybdopterin synthase catalytic subunit